MLAVALALLAHTTVPIPPPEVRALDEAATACLDGGLARADPNARARAVADSILAQCRPALDAYAAAYDRWMLAWNADDPERYEHLRLIRSDRAVGERSGLIARIRRARRGR